MVNSLFQWLLLSIASAIHPFFVSMCDINHNAKDKTVEISVRIFSDDLESTLKKSYSTSFDIIKPVDRSSVDKMISGYISNHLVIQIDGKIHKLNYIGYEIKEASAWCYFEIENIVAIKSVSVTNSLLYDFNKNQINLIHLKMNGKEKSQKLDYPQTAAQFNW